MEGALRACEAEELSILGYMKARGSRNTIAVLREELGLSQAVFPPIRAAQYSDILERKWNTVTRLEQRARDLENSIASLEAELKRNKQPQPPPKSKSRIAVPKQTKENAKSKKYPKLRITTSNKIRDGNKPPLTPYYDNATRDLKKANEPPPPPVPAPPSNTLVTIPPSKITAPKSTIKAEERRPKPPVPAITAPTVIRVEERKTKPQAPHITAPTVTKVEERKTKPPAPHITAPTVIKVEERKKKPQTPPIAAPTVIKIEERKPKPAVPDTTAPTVINVEERKPKPPVPYITAPTMSEVGRPTLLTPISEVATPAPQSPASSEVQTPTSDITTPILTRDEGLSLQTPISDIRTPTLLNAEWPVLQTPESKSGTPRTRKSKQRTPLSQTSEPNSRTSTPRRRVKSEKQLPYEPETSPWVPPSKPAFQSKSHGRTVNALAFHPSLPSLASGSDDATIKIWDWETGNLETTIPAHKEGVRDLDFGGPKGSVWLASSSSDMTIKIWDQAEGYKNIHTLSGHDHAVLSVRFLPLGDSSKVLLASGSADKTIKIWDATTGHCIKALRGHDDWVRTVRPSADGQFLLSCSSDNTARVWDIHSPSPDAIRRSVSHEEVITCCAFAPATAHRYILRLAAANKIETLASSLGYFVTSSRDKTIKIWDGTGKCIVTLYGHDDEVNAIEFHADGRYILSAADDKTVRVWDLAYKGACISVLRGMHNGFVTCLRWVSPREKSLGSSTATLPDQSSEVVHVFATGSMDRKVSIFKS